MDITNLEQSEIKWFEHTWPGGYWNDIKDERNKAIPNTLEPFFTKQGHCLEIGPGRGAWTKWLISLVSQITAVDTASAETNQFWKYVEQQKNISYHQIKNLDLEFIPDNSIDCIFSYDVFCHIPPVLTEKYFHTFKRVMKNNAFGFIMYADFKQYNNYYEQRKISQRVDGESMHWFDCPHLEMKRIVEQNGLVLIDANYLPQQRDPVVYFKKEL